MRSARRLLALLLLPGLTCGTARAGDFVRVQGTDTNQGETPVVGDAPGDLAPGLYQLRGRDGTVAPIPALVFRDQNQPKLGFILSAIPAHFDATYEVVADASPSDAKRGIAFRAEGTRIVVTVDGHPWTTYVPDDGPKPCFDPLIGPGEVALTRGYPMREAAGESRDHPHHRSMWFAHQDVNKANTWDQNPGHGSIRETARPTVVGVGGPVGVLRTTNDWLDRDGRKLCSDERAVTFYATKKARVFDFTITIRATDKPVTMGDNKDGTFAIRMADSMAVTAKQGGRITTSRGLIDKAAWGQPAEWVDYSGPVGGGTRGIAILNAPTSFRAPTTWHVRDYGLFAANPFGWHDFGQKQSGSYTIEPGQEIQLSYRVILHDGDAPAAGIAEQYRIYAGKSPVSRDGLK